MVEAETTEYVWFLHQICVGIREYAPAAKTGSVCIHVGLKLFLVYSAGGKVLNHNIT